MKGHDERGRRGATDTLVAILLTVNMVAAAALGGYLYWHRQTRRQKAEAAEAAALPAITNYRIKPLIVNLDEPGEIHYLRTEIFLQVEDPAVVAELDQRLPEVRHAILTYLSSLGVDDLTDLQHRDGIRDTVRGRINDLLTTGSVAQVNFAELLLQ